MVPSFVADVIHRGRADAASCTAWLMNIAFFSQACALLAIAHGLRRSLEPGRRVEASVRLIYTTGVTQLFTAVVNSDSIADADAGRSSWHGTLHDLFGFVGFVCLTLATFFLRGVFARDAQWRRFAPHALLFGFSAVAAFALVLFTPADTFGIARGCSSRSPPCGSGLSPVACSVPSPRCEVISDSGPSHGSG